MKVDYTQINRRFIAGDELELPQTEIGAFQDYLLNNRVAFLYATRSQQDQAFVRRIREVGERYHDRYVRSLTVIKKVCAEAGIEYLLYKTHHYVPQIPDGDIDLLVRPEHFAAFMHAFAERGFATEVDEEGKGKCVHPDYSVIEPHLNVSWRGVGCADSAFLWSDPREVEIDGDTYKTASFEVELLSLAAKVVFEPAYLDLHSLLTIQYLYDNGVDERVVLDNSVDAAAVRSVLQLAKHLIADPADKLPAFLPTARFFQLWSRHLLKNREPKVYLLHSVYFLYWKYRYAVRNTLPFTHHHEWQAK